MNKLLSNEDIIMKTFSNSTRSYLDIFYIPFIFYYCQQVLFTLRVSSLPWPLNDASSSIVDNEGSFQFPPEGEFTSPLYVHIILAIDTEAEFPCYSAKSQLLQC